jgi:hypothetical protein
VYRSVADVINLNTATTTQIATLRGDRLEGSRAWVRVPTTDHISERNYGWPTHTWVFQEKLRAAENARLKRATRGDISIRVIVPADSSA